MKCDDLFVYCKTTCDPQRLYYSKSEVNKLLAENDAEIAELKQELEDVNELIKTARQMLEDAKACYLRFVRYENYLQKLCASNATIAAYKFRRDLYDKWEKRWLELADKFKEAK